MITAEDLRKTITDAIESFIEKNDLDEDEINDLLSDISEDISEMGPS